jgi:hypothetical protein
MSGTRNTSSAKYNVVKKLPKVMYIEWVDAQTIGGSEWLDQDEMKQAAKSSLPVMNTVGYLIYEDERQYGLVAVLGPSESSQVHKIPKCMVLSIRELDG